MSISLAAIDVCAVHAHILTSSQHLDAMVKHLLTSLGFTDDPAQWPSEVEHVLPGLAGSARLVASQQICTMAQSFRDRQFKKDTTERIVKMVCNKLEFKATLQMLIGLTSTDTYMSDPECRNIIRSHLPELDQKLATFEEDLAPLETMQEELMPSYNVLASQRLELEVALNGWLRTEISDELVVAIKAAIVQLSELADERRAIVERADDLLSSSMSSDASLPQEYQARIHEDLRGLARSLAVQVTVHRLHLTAVANIVHTMRSEFPALRVCGFEVAVPDLLATRGKHSVFEGRLAALSERAEQLSQMLACMVNILRLDARLNQPKRSSVQAP